MRVACVMMQRNEDLCLRPWLLWHGNLFGYENLYVIDHGSDDAGVLESLVQAEKWGVHVLRLPAGADFLRKGEFNTGIMRMLQETGQYDLLFPLDCDEFVVIRDERGQTNAVPEMIREYLGTLTGEVFEVCENFLNMLGQRDIFFALPYQKVFFHSGAVRGIDQGAHICMDGTRGSGGCRWKS
jgi:hypothetical protein